MVNHCEVHAIFPDIEHQLQENILHHCFHCSFLMKSSLNSEVSSTHSKTPTGSFCAIAQPYKLLTSQYLRYDNSFLYMTVFIIIFHIFIISFCISVNRVTINSTVTTINSISISVNNSNSTLVLFKAAWQASPAAEKKLTGFN